MILEQFIDKYSNLIDDLRFKDLNNLLVNTEDIFRLDDNVIKQLNNLLMEEVGLDLLYEAEQDDNYVVITNDYCKSLCGTKNNPFYYSYKTKLNPYKTPLDIFYDLLNNSRVFTLFDIVKDSDNDILGKSDIEALLTGVTKTKFLELGLEYSGGRFQIELNLGYNDLGNFFQVISFIKYLDENYGYGFSKSVLDSKDNNYAINDKEIDKLMKHINDKILLGLK